TRSQQARSVATEYATIGRPASSRSALLRPAAMRSPRPPASTTPTVAASGPHVVGFKPQLNLAQADQVAGVHRRRSLYRAVVQPRAIGALEVLHPPLALLLPNSSMMR